MPLAVPVSLMQFWVFLALSLLFFTFLLLAASRRTKESGARSDGRSRIGILLQSMGIAFAGLGATRPSLSPSSFAGLAGTAAVILLMGGSIGLFAASSRALGRNWSLVARTRSDHELVRSGPYAWIRHPIYLAMLFFLLALAVAVGHWLQLLVAVPTFLLGTAIRTRSEDRLLETRFGQAFGDYRSSTPALIPRMF